MLGLKLSAVDAHPYALAHAEPDTSQAAISVATERQGSSRSGNGISCNNQSSEKMFRDTSVTALYRALQNQQLHFSDAGHTASMLDFPIKAYTGHKTKLLATDFVPIDQDISMESEESVPINYVEIMPDSKLVLRNSDDTTTTSDAGYDDSTQFPFVETAGNEVMRLVTTDATSRNDEIMATASKTDSVDGKETLAPLSRDTITQTGNLGIVQSTALQSRTTKATVVVTEETSDTHKSTGKTKSVIVFDTAMVSKPKTMIEFCNQSYCQSLKSVVIGESTDNPNLPSFQP